MKLTLGEIATTLGSRVQGSQRVAQGYSIDSRSVKRGDLFFAIRGPNRDGHQFVRQALELGAVGAVIEQEKLDLFQDLEDAELIPVSGTTTALQRLAQTVRRRWGKRLVGVTGSTGKTTTKEMIAAVLAARFRVLKSPGNLNNQFGVPLSLLALEPDHEIAVLEMGMSAAGEIASLASMAGPQTGVVTNVAPVHLEFFESVESIARAKRELIEGLEPPRAAILNFDDDRVRRFTEGFDGRVLTFGFKPGAQFRCLEMQTFGAEPGQVIRTEFSLVSAPYTGKFALPAPGRHNVENALAAIATAALFEIPEAGVRNALQHFKAPGQRAEFISLAHGVVLINDSYNSNPKAMERMLETLRDWPCRGRRIVVAGEMLELGPSSPQLHREVGAICTRNGIDWLAAVQGDARYFLDGARQAGFALERMAYFDRAREAAEFCCGLLAPGDVVLVKGSRGVHLEELVNALRGDGKTP
ncbi:MAG TPA: UDP-N-acetylmuramoyl-tripeptide--D-alanyl-D-alanine ligase [Terriglobia bacterium]|nr:UDP-N-acetylmuramoyl-tripeptide--D-alanyl-D-alanine ligase [Terriglobia bacterium]